MANTLTEVMPKILARGLMALRQRVIMPRIVNNDYSTDAAKLGDVINVPIPASQAAEDVTPSNTPPTPASKAPTSVPITLDNWKHSDFHLTDLQLTQIDANAHFIPMQMGEAVKALANAINQDIMAEYKGIYGYVGTAGTTPFASDVTAATQAAKVLNQQLADKAERRAVLDFTAEANAKALAPFRDVSQSGDNRVIIEGEIGRKLGFDWFADDHIPTHTTGAAGTPLIDNGAGYAVGIKSIHLDGLTTAPSVGDIFTIAGDTQTYVIITASVLATTDCDVTIEPGLVVAADDNDALTFKASHAVNLAFHRDAFAFATRQLTGNQIDQDLGGKMLSMQDPKTGLVLRLEVTRQYKQTVWDFDVLWGAKLVRRELACRIAG